MQGADPRQAEDAAQLERAGRIAAPQGFEQGGAARLEDLLDGARQPCADPGHGGQSADAGKLAQIGAERLDGIGSAKVRARAMSLLALEGEQPADLAQGPGDRDPVLRAVRRGPVVRVCTRRVKRATSHEQAPEPRLRLQEFSCPRRG